jgi:hypothetical protein
LNSSGPNQDGFNDLTAVLMNGVFLALDSLIPDKATVDVFTPLAGGTGGQAAAPPASPSLPRSRAVVSLPLTNARRQRGRNAHCGRRRTGTGGERDVRRPDGGGTQGKHRKGETRYGAGTASPRSSRSTLGRISS